MKNLLSLLLAFFLGGCTSSDELVVNEADLVVQDVMCGCNVDGVGKCGNYIRIEGKYVPLIHPKLGEMEFCRHQAAGTKIKTKGVMKDGEFVAEHWLPVE